MNDKTKSFALECRGTPGKSGDRPVLTGVQASARLDGVLFELTLRQTYRNDSDKLLEVVYTFPLPVEAVLLGLATELNGARMEGTVVAKRQAERQYEEALAQGDAPVMLEALGDGLHTANIGNLKSGDEIVVEVRFAQLLRFEQGRLRLAIPMAIAPRYGHAEAAGLQPQQVPQASIAAEYPLRLALTIAGGLAGGAVDCPTHPISRAKVEGRLRLELASRAWLDRDVVFVVTPGEPRPSLLVRADDGASQAAPIVLMAALQPPMGKLRDRVTLKLLVDCSGSMGGDSIASARQALHGALASLHEHDTVSLSRFGNTVVHALAPATCTAQTLRQLKSLVDATDATLGGTEMEGALREVFALRSEHRSGDGADVLLITDGEIWQAERMIVAARASKQRVFAVGVGASPAEGVLRALAEATGGACEFATPGEALQAAAQRMLARIRQQPLREARIDWGGKTVWQSPLPSGVFGGDTVIAFAGLAQCDPDATVRLLAVDAVGNTIELARCDATALAPGDALPRIAAARRCAGADEDEALGLALTYQLMSKQTNCVLVHRRAQADKATEQAELHRVSSMLAAGWGATATVLESVSACYSVASPSSVRFSRSSLACGDFELDSMDVDSDLPSTASHSASLDAIEPATLKDLALAVVELLAHGGQVNDLPAHCAGLPMHPDVRQALDQAAFMVASDGRAWLLLAHWTNARADGLARSDVAAALQPSLAGRDETLVQKCMALFDRLLGDYPIDGWSPKRAQRLRRALGRAVSKALP